VHTLLVSKKDWPADKLQSSGEYRWCVSSARLSGQGSFGGHGEDQELGFCIVWGFLTRKRILAYRIEREGYDKTRITLLAYMPRTVKIGIALVLALIYIVPVSLSPLLWKVYEAQTLRASKVYLPAFCRYL
jgi:hypothetical protein